MRVPAGSPRERFEALTYAGESLVDAVAVSGGTVGVTSHRVLALTPEGAGPTLDAVELPNVESVRVSTAGADRHGVRAVRFGVYALAMIGGSYLLRFDGFGTVDPPAATGAGEVVSIALAMTDLLAVVDDALRAAGVLVLLVALGFAARYGRSRGRGLAIAAAGRDPLRVPLRREEAAVADRVRAAVEKASNPSAG